MRRHQHTASPEELCHRAAVFDFFGKPGESVVVEICLHRHGEIDIPEIRYALAAIEQDGPIEVRLDRDLPSAERDLRIAAGDDLAGHLGAGRERAQCEIERAWRRIRSTEGAVPFRSKREGTSFNRHGLFDAFARAEEREGYQSAAVMA
jgi:hypothetical protein